MHDDLYRHMEWADATVWRTVLDTPAAADDQKIAEKLLHLHMVQQAYIFLWRGEEPKFGGATSKGGLQPVRELARDYYAQLPGILSGFDESKLDAPFDIPWAAEIAKQLGRDVAAVTLRDTLLQIPMHSAYHRGQVNTRLRELGATPPLVDYIAWAWFGKPAAEWS
jgi:uncharacterized damage-inducible protein DinB